MKCNLHSVICTRVCTKKVFRRGGGELQGGAWLTSIKQVLEGGVCPYLFLLGASQLLQVHS